MPRLARVVAVDYPHHVTHRGNRRDDVFFDDAQRRRYLRFLAEYARAARMDVWAWCLMSNHVHLIVAPRREDALARGVGLAHRRYAVWLNRQEKLTGHLWANRYYSTPLDEVHHWAAVRYVERNPVRAGLVGAAEDYPWSSARAHVAGGEAAVVRGEGAGLLSPDRPYPGPVVDWRAWLAEPEEIAATERLRQSTRTGRPCGGRRFVARLEELLGRRLWPRKAGRKPKGERDEEDGQLDLLEETGK